MGTDYWTEVHYNYDAYYDTHQRVSRPKEATVGQRLKRKREEEDLADKEERKSAKFSKIACRLTYDFPPLDAPVVLWQSRSGRSELRSARKLKQAPSQPLALLKDWPQRFANRKSFDTAKKQRDSAVELNVLPEVQDDAEVPDLEGDEWEDEEEEERVDMAGLDPQALQMALQNALGGAGGAGMPPEQQALLLQFAEKMIKGEGDSDMLAGQLAEQLLGPRGQEGEEDEEDEGDGEEAAMPEWLAARMRAGRSEATGAAPQVASMHGGAAETDPIPALPGIPQSSSEGRIDSALPSQESIMSNVAVHSKAMDIDSFLNPGQALVTAGAPSGTVQSKKRKAADDEKENDARETAQPKAKRTATAPSFAQPTAASKSRTTSAAHTAGAAGTRKGRTAGKRA